MDGALNLSRNTAASNSSVNSVQYRMPYMQSLRSHSGCTWRHVPMCPRYLHGTANDLGVRRLINQTWKYSPLHPFFLRTLAFRIEQNFKELNFICPWCFIAVICGTPFPVLAVVLNWYVSCFGNSRAKYWFHEFVFQLFPLKTGTLHSKFSMLPIFSWLRIEKLSIYGS
jgi:hypothetical protein